MFAVPHMSISFSPRKAGNITKTVCLHSWKKKFKIDASKEENTQMKAKLREWVNDVAIYTEMFVELQKEVKD